jgi:hypothetical protein
MTPRSEFAMDLRAVVGSSLMLMLSFPCGAQAQTPAPMEIGVSNSFINMTGQAPKDTDDARSRGNNLVSTQHASGEFENITDSNQVRIRHIKSGVICEVPNALIVSPPTEIETLSSSRKFTCINEPNNFQNDISITANNYSLNVNRALAAIVAEARAEMPHLNYYPARVSWEENPAPNVNGAQPIVARLSTGDKPDSRYLYVSVVILHGWIISDSIRGTLAQKDRVEFAGNEMMRRAMRDAKGSH